MSTSICILCFEPLLKATDLNLVDGKSKVNAELEDLPFVVHHSSPYICKRCLGVMKKRKNLKENLCKTDEHLTVLYRQKCGDYGFSMKRREPGSVVTRKLKFPNDPNMQHGIQMQDYEIQEEILEENQYSSSPSESQNQNQLPAHRCVSTPVSKGPTLNHELTLSPIVTEVDMPKPKRMPSECPVTVSIKWADRTKTKVLPQELSAIGKMLCRGTNKQIARAAWQCDKIRQHLYEEVVKQIHKECVAMCVKGTTKEKKKREDSCLRKTDKDSIINFSFDNLIQELKERAPLFLLVLKTAALKVNDDEEKWKPSVGVAAAVCLRNRSRNMIAVQLMIAIINRHSGFMV